MMLKLLAIITAAQQVVGFGGGKVGIVDQDQADQQPKTLQRLNPYMFCTDDSVYPTMPEAYPKALSQPNKEIEAHVRAGQVDLAYYEFKPTGQGSGVGFIMYSGGPVWSDAYSPMASRLAAGGHSVFVPGGCGMGMITNPTIPVDTTSEIIKNNPQISKWVVGGHSLGGVVAGKMMKDLPEAHFDGILLWDSCLYSPMEPHDVYDVSNYDNLKAMTIFRINQYTEVEDMHNSTNCRSMLPATKSEYFGIEGANHPQFGYYEDPNPEQVPLTREEQQDIIFDVTSKWMDSL